MNLNSRLDRLEASEGQMMTTGERQAAIDRYTAAYATATPAGGVTPEALASAISSTRSSFQQQLLSCWLPGDDKI